MQGGESRFRVEIRKSEVLPLVQNDLVICMAAHNHPDILDDPDIDLSREDQIELHEIARYLDSGGTIPRKALDVIIRHRHFHLYVPEERGGLNYSLLRGMKVIQAYAYIDGNLGWNVQIGAGGGIFSAYLDKAVSERFLGQPHQVIAGSDFVGGTAEPATDDSGVRGYHISGKWNYASGASYATAFTGNCRISGGPYSGQIRAVILPSRQVEVIQNWNAMGMRATDSHAFQVHREFISESQLFSLDPADLQISNRTTNLPFDLYARALFFPVLTGVAHRYLTDFRSFIRKGGSGTRKSEGELADQLERLLNDGRQSVFDLADNIWTDQTAQSTPDQSEILNRTFQIGVVNTTNSLSKAIDSCHRYTGMKGIRMDEPLNILYRNFKTVIAHRLFRP